MTEFDPIDHACSVKAKPSAYVPIATILKAIEQRRPIREAATLAELRFAYTGPYKAAKEAGETDLMEMLTEAKDARKKQLEGEN